jgi:hypothetical protein
LSIQSVPRSFLLLAALALSVAPAAVAQPLSTGKTAGSKLVHLQIRNDGDHTISLHCGDQHLSIQPHATVSARIREGESVVLDAAVSKLPAGYVVATVGSQLENATLVLK